MNHVTILAGTVIVDVKMDISVKCVTSLAKKSIMEKSVPSYVHKIVEHADTQTDSVLVLLGIKIGI